MLQRAILFDCQLLASHSLAQGPCAYSGQLSVPLVSPQSRQQSIKLIEASEADRQATATLAVGADVHRRPKSV
jgi:hypothetical protein